MAGELLPARFSLRSKLWFRWTGKCFETATSHMQTVKKITAPKFINYNLHLRLGQKSLDIYHFLNFLHRST